MMIARFCIAACLTLAAVSAQQAARPAAPKASGQIALPAGAEKVSEGVYRAKDVNGKVWIYTRTPFGFARNEEGAAPAAPRPEMPVIRVLDVKGDTVRFVRDTPFGKAVWTRTVAELNDKEKAAYEASLAASQKASQ